MPEKRGRAPTSSHNSFSSKTFGRIESLFEKDSPLPEQLLPERFSFQGFIPPKTTVFDSIRAPLRRVPRSNV